MSKKAEAFLQFVQAASSLAKQGMKKSEILKFAKLQFGKVTDEITKAVESKRLQRARAQIVVISTPVDHPKNPVWEMHLSSGAVCMNLLSSAQSMGYAAQWLTVWYAYNNKMLIYLGGREGIDKISGFIYIGHKKEEPNERRRPDPLNVISYI